MNNTRESKRGFGAVLIALFALLLTTTPGRAQSWSLSGSVSADLSWFSKAPALPGQLEDQQDSVVLAPEWRWLSEDRRHQVKIAPFARWDAEDDERTHFDLREGFYRYSDGGWDLLAGAGKVFWGVAESRHLVDVINQTDAVEDIDEEDKLGQPMVRLGLTRSWGRLELYSLPGFRERTFPGVDGRLRAPLVVDDESTLYESGAGNRHVDWALRWSNAIGDWDLGAHVFHGTAREPRLFLGGGNASGPADAELVPVYELISQIGLDVQYTRNAWLYKFEGLVREGQGETFGAAVAGAEYTLYQVVGAADLGLIAELHWDDRVQAAGTGCVVSGAGEAGTAVGTGCLAPTIYDEDIFLGSRLALNDMQNTSVLAGALVDRDDRSTAIFIEAERRLTDRISLEVEGRFFVNVDPAGDLAAVERDDVFTVSAAWNL